MGLLVNTKRAQLQIQETILVVFIFIILIILGMVFFYRVQSASIADDFREFQSEKLAVDFITLGDLPEFSCSRAGVRENCVDTVKMTAFQGLAGENGRLREYYLERFGYKNVTVYQIYPVRNNAECGRGRISDCGVWNIYTEKPARITSKRVLDTPVSLYFPCSAEGCTDDNYAIGLMVVEAYGGS